MIQIKFPPFSAKSVHPSVNLPPDEWLLFLKLRDYAARKKPQKKLEVIQLPLPDLDGDHMPAGESLG